MRLTLEELEKARCSRFGPSLKTLLNVASDEGFTIKESQIKKWVGGEPTIRKFFAIHAADGQLKLQGWADAGVRPALAALLWDTAKQQDTEVSR